MCLCPEDTVADTNHHVSMVPTSYATSLQFEQSRVKPGLSQWPITDESVMRALLEEHDREVAQAQAEAAAHAAWLENFPVPLDPGWELPKDPGRSLYHLYHGRPGKLHSDTPHHGYKEIKSKPMEAEHLEYMAELALKMRAGASTTNGKLPSEAGHTPEPRYGI
ncbi:hypothetical protein FRC10_008488 [Ceratobasidium sp. 414]|nr:hypothetical protein FRC10_008488 [Ceratobasidium sp. 414]